MIKILIIEDEKKIHEVLNAYMKKEGFSPYFFTTGESGYSAFLQLAPDLIILDLMLPDISGEEICKRIRMSSKTPIIMLTAKSSENSRINGFELGTDDYLIKPFSPKELIMRIKSILKRTYGLNKSNNTISFNSGDLEINLLEGRIFKAKVSLNLTPIEFRILEFFIKNNHQILSRNQLIENVLGINFTGYDRTIDAHIKNLRKKIEDNPKDPKYIFTVFGFGYKFEGENDEK